MFYSQPLWPISALSLLRELIVIHQKWCDTFRQYHMQIVVMTLPDLIPTQNASKVVLAHTGKGKPASLLQNNSVSEKFCGWRHHIESLLEKNFPEGKHRDGFSSK